MVQLLLIAKQPAGPVKTVTLGFLPPSFPTPKVPQPPKPELPQDPHVPQSTEEIAEAGVELVEDVLDVCGSPRRLFLLACGLWLGSWGLLYLL